MANSRYIAFRCIDCGLINVYPSNTCDGHKCKCGGIITPVGDAYVHSKRDCTVNIKVDTTELDIALDKARELNNLARGCNNANI